MQNSKIYTILNDVISPVAYWMEHVHDDVDISVFLKWVNKWRTEIPQAFKTISLPSGKSVQYLRKSSIPLIEKKLAEKQMAQNAPPDDATSKRRNRHRHGHNCGKPHARTQDC